MYYLTNGGILMYVILIMSIVGIAAVIERFIYFRKNEKESRSFLTKDIKEQLENRNLKELIIMLNKEKSSVSKVLKEVLFELYRNPSSSTEKLEEKGKEKAMLQLALLEKNMWLISLAAHLTPLIGLLGTVTGMIKAFQTVSIYGTGDAAVLAKGISEALFTTAGGLFVAIPAIMFYNYFNKKIERIVSDMEITTTELINYFRK